MSKSSKSGKKIKIDQKKCIGCGLCATLCPEYFKLGSNSKAQQIKNPRSSKIIKEAVLGCPTQSITIE